MNSMEIQDIVLQEMKNRGISYRQFARMVGCGLSTIQAWRDHRYGIGVDLADKALKALGMSVKIGAEND